MEEDVTNRSFFRSVRKGNPDLQVCLLFQTIQSAIWVLLIVLSLRLLDSGTPRTGSLSICSRRRQAILILMASDPV